MTNVFSRRLFVGSLASVLASPVFANAPAQSLRPRARGGDFFKKAVLSAEQLVSNAKLGGKVAYTVADARSGRVLEQADATVGLPPASVAKAVTAAYALSVLGGGHRFRTRVLANGPIQNGVLNGDLILAGGGDPTLNTDTLAELAKAMKSAGVSAVRGKFLVWGGALPYAKEIDTSQPGHVGYNPALSGLNLNYNRVHFEWRRGGNGYSVTMDARSEKYRPDVSIARMKIVARDVPVYTYASKSGRDEWTVARGALGKGGARWLPVRQPERYAGDVFQTFARSQGIVLPNPVVLKALPANVSEIAGKNSAQLADILRDMLKYSTNLTAEIVGMTASRARAGRVTSIKSSAQTMSRWARDTLGLKTVNLVDHSGLGDASRMSSADMVAALVAVRPQLGLDALLKPIAMRDGKRKVIKNHPLKVRAKTGTLNFVSGLAGFIVAKDGTELAFAIFAADTKRRARLSRAEREKPEGAAGWNRRAKILQQNLIDRWGSLYGV